MIVRALVVVGLVLAAARQASAQDVCFYQSSLLAGFNRICTYSCVSGPLAVTIKSTDTCSLTTPGAVGAAPTRPPLDVSPANSFIAAMQAGQRDKIAREQHEQGKETHALTMQLLRQQLADLQRDAQQRDQQAAQKHAQAAQAAATEAIAKTLADEDIQTLTARRPDWRTYEKAMLAYSAKIPAGALDMQDYLDALYFLAKRDAVDAALTQAAKEQAAAVMAAFTLKHPEWRQHETQMMENAKRIPKTETISEAEYLEVLYVMALNGK